MKKYRYFILTAFFLFISLFSQVVGGVLPTSLRITVLDELGNPVDGAEVTIFLTKEDYKAEINPVHPTGKTDVKGRVTFKSLQAVPYYVHVEFDKKSNIGAGVLTAPLQEGKSNRVNTVIE